jgi:hypothetical protein
MVSVRRGNPQTNKPDRLIMAALGSIDVMAEAMWIDDVIRETGQQPPHKWVDLHPDKQECWIRRGTAALLALLGHEKDA